MFFKSYKKRKNTKHFWYIKLLTGIIIFAIIINLAVASIQSIINLFSENPIALSIISITCIIVYLASIVLKRYGDYLQYGSVKISRLQLISILKTLSPRQFEYFCAELFKELGHKVHLMPDGPDGGKDVILDNKIYVECKRYNSSIVGREICQKLLGAVEADGMEKGIIFTNGKLNKNGLEMFAKTKRLELWNIDTIYIKLNSLENHRASIILDKSLKYNDNNEEKETNFEFSFDTEE